MNRNLVLKDTIPNRCALVCAVIQQGIDFIAHESVMCGDIDLELDKAEITFRGTDQLQLLYAYQNVRTEIAGKTKGANLYANACSTTLGVTYENVSSESEKSLRMVTRDVYWWNQLGDDYWEDMSCSVPGCYLDHWFDQAPDIEFDPSEFEGDTGKEWLDHIASHWGPKLFEITKGITKRYPLKSGKTEPREENLHRFSSDDFELPDWSTFPPMVKALKDTPELVFAAHFRDENRIAA